MKSLTEQEIITENQANLHLMEKNIRNRKYSLEEFSELIPGLVHINHVDDFAMNFVNRYGEEKFEKPLEEIKEEGAAFVEKFFEPGSLEIFSQPLIQMVQTNDDTNVVSFFQKVKLNQQVDYNWLLTTSKILKGSREFISVSQLLSNADSSTRAINRLLDDNLYLRKNMNKFGALTKREKQILKMVATGYTTNQIAGQLFLSPHTISTHRKNIGQKLDLKNLTDWERFANTFDF